MLTQPQLTSDKVISLIHQALPGLRINAARVRLPGPQVDYAERNAAEDITPRRAMELIAACWERYENGRNFYPTKLSKILTYAEHMTNGTWEWRETSDPICITDGLVTGGRHRLHAILLSNTTHKFNVRYRTIKDQSNGNHNHTEGR